MNVEQVRPQNRSLILKYINRAGPSSRKEIAATTGLTPASVTQITTSLIAEGILREAGTVSRTSGGRGRREVPLAIQADRFLTFTINAEPDATTVAVCDLTGNLVKDAGGEPLLRAIPTSRDCPPEDFLHVLGDCCLELSARMPEEKRKYIENLSFTVTGIVDRENGISSHAYGIWTSPVDVRKILGSYLHLPVLLENNVDAYAIAEMLFGIGRAHDHLLLIKWGPGVGSSVVIDGHVYRGRNGKSAELGHMIVDPSGELCVCGRRGCLETVASAKALERAEKHGNRKAAVDTFARSVVNAGTLLAPDRIVLFGSLTNDPLLREEVIRSCRSYAPSFDERRIVPTALAGKEKYIGPSALFTMRKMQS